MIPKTLDEYFAWARETLGSDFDDARNRRIYEVNLNNCYNVVAEHPFFKGLQTELERWDSDYRSATNSGLLMERTPPTLLQKPYLSAVDKTFRENVLWNREFPDPPKKGWSTVDNLYSRLNDLIRCCIVCKFIDGPGFVTDRLMEYAKNLGLERRRYSQERDEGYYAFHYYVRFAVKLIDRAWQEWDSAIEVEIQVTTQLQDVLRSLTHNFYEQSRLLTEEDSSKWKWDFTSNRFRVGYLSHTLHLLESIILESRDEISGQDSRGKADD